MEGPGDLGLAAFQVRGAICLAGRAEGKGIVVTVVDHPHVAESFPGGTPFAPLIVFALAAQQPLALAPESGVVVGDDLVGLDVALARGHDIGPRILQHGDEEGEHVTLGVHVLDSGEERGPLPGPAAPFLVVISPVALPEGDVAAAQAARVLLRVESGDEWDRASAPVFITVFVGGCESLVPEGGGDEVLGRVPAAEDAAYRAVGVLGRHQLVNLVLEPVQSGLGPLVVAEFLAEAELQRRPALRHALDPDPGLDRRAALEPGPQRVADRKEVAGGVLCLRGQQRKGQQKGGEKSLKHGGRSCSGRL